MPAIVAAILGSLGRAFVDKLAYFVAMKALLVLLMVTVLPLILKNLLNWFLASVYDIVNANVGSETIPSFAIQLTGLGAYFATHFQLPLCFSIVITAVIVRFTLNMIPFIR